MSISAILTNTAYDFEDGAVWHSSVFYISLWESTQPDNQRDQELHVEYWHDNHFYTVAINTEW